MRSTYQKSIFVALGTAMLWVTTLPMAFAQETTRGSVVIYPIVYSRNSGTKSSRQTAVRAVQEALQKAKYTLISDTVAAKTWTHLRIPPPATKRPSTRSEIVQFGKTMKARYVIAPVFDFHSRSIWVNLGPKTVSTATVGITITDVQDEKVVYKKKDIKGRSDEKTDALKVAADVLITPLVTVVSGGPKTPQEQRAVQIAVAKALKDWVKSTE